MSTQSLLRSEESREVTISAREKTKYLSPFDLSYWIPGYKVFLIEVRFPAGCMFKPEHIFIVDTNYYSAAAKEASFGVVVHGQRLSEASREIVLMTTQFQTYLPNTATDIELKLLTECDGKSLRVSLN